MKISGIWPGIIIICIGVLVLALPDLIRWLVGVGIIVIGVLAIVKR